MRRPSSPSGRSTLNRSAPRSAKIAPANGPASTWPSSITRRPASGNGLVMSLHLDLGLGDDALPFGDLRDDARTQRLGRARRELHAVLGHAPAHPRLAHDLVPLSLPLGCHRPRPAGA